MTREEAIEILKDGELNPCVTEDREACDMAIKALKPKPMQKFDNVKQHIDRLAGDYKCWDERLSHEEALELSRMLEQEPCDDVISRRAVLDTLDKMDSVLDENRTVETYKELLATCYNDLPSVTPAPKKCHNVNTNYGECDQFVCSNCGIELQDWSRIERNEDGDDIIYHEYEFKYCPNCGAKIDEREEE